MQLKSLQFIRHLQICNCTTVSGFVWDSFGWCLQGQQRQQEINTTTLYSHSGQELTNTRLQEKPREAKHNGPKYHQKSLMSRHVHYAVCWKGRARRDSDDQLKHHRAPSVWFRNQKTGPWCFPCISRGLPTVSFAACPRVTSVPQTGCPPSCHYSTAQRWLGMLQLSCWWCPKSLRAQPLASKPAEHRL